MYKIPITHVFSDERCVGITKYREPSHALLHIHDFYEIEYVLDGRGSHIINGNEFPADEGDLFFINIDVPHCFKSSSDKDPIVVYNCVFSPVFFEKMKTFFCPDSQQNSPSDYALDTILNQPYLQFHNILDFRSIMEAMYNESKGELENYIEVINGLLIELLNSIVTAYNMIDKRNPKKTSLDVAKNYIDSHFSEQITNDMLAHMSMLSPSYFCASFKKLYGCTVSQYILSVRLDAAKKLLTETNEPIKNVAARVGYNSEGFFRNAFNKTFGMSPSAYRNLSL